MNGQTASTHARQETTVRAFVALVLNEAIRKELDGIQRRLSTIDVRVSWVKPDNIHLTLIFMGNVPTNGVIGVTRVMDAVAAGAPPFSYDVNGLGYFGSSRSPRTIWAGARRTPVLSALRQDLCSSLTDSDIPLDIRNFKAHLTLGRVRTKHGASELAETVRSLAGTSFGRVPVDAMLLVKSDLKPSGPEYSILHRSMLTAPAES